MLRYTYPIFEKEGESTVLVMENLLLILADPDLPNSARHIWHILFLHKAIGANRGLTIKQIAAIRQALPSNISSALKTLTFLGLVDFKREKNSPKIFYIPRRLLQYEEVEPPQITNLRQKKEVQKIDLSDKEADKLSEKIKVISKDKETFNYFNEAVAREFGESRKLRVFNEKRKRAVKNMLKAFTLDEVKQGIDGFLISRKENDIDYLDLHYVERNFELYLSKGGEFKVQQEKQEETEEEKKARIEARIQAGMRQMQFKEA